MPPIYLLLIIYSVLIFAMSLGGGTLPMWLRLTHTLLQIAMSLIGGLMLGVGLLHLLPHAYVALHSIDQTVVCLLVGLLTMFCLIRVFHVHQHAPGENAHGHCQHGVPHSHSDPHLPQADLHVHTPAPVRRMNWIGLMIGLSLHTLIDGIALASSVAVESHDSTPGLWGFGAFLAIFLHKPLDAMSITTVMTAGGWSNRSTQIVNVLFALMCPLGALGFALGVGWLVTEHQQLLGMALAFSAGVFLCISLSDLLPEVQFHSHDRFILTTALFVGVLIAYLITFIEPPHVHGRDGEHADHVHEESD